MEKTKKTKTIRAISAIKLVLALFGEGRWELRSATAQIQSCAVSYINFSIPQQQRKWKKRQVVNVEIFRGAPSMRFSIPKKKLPCENPSGGEEKKCNQSAKEGERERQFSKREKKGWNRTLEKDTKIIFFFAVIIISNKVGLLIDSSKFYECLLYEHAKQINNNNSIKFGLLNWHFFEWKSQEKKWPIFKIYVFIFF